MSSAARRPGRQVQSQCPGRVRRARLENAVSSAERGRSQRRRTPGRHRITPPPLQTKPWHIFNFRSDSKEGFDHRHIIGHVHQWWSTVLILLVPDSPLEFRFGASQTQSTELRSANTCVRGHLLWNRRPRVGSSGAARRWRCCPVYISRTVLADPAETSQEQLNHLVFIK